MGDIISSRIRDDGKVVFEVVVDYEESRQLQGHMDKIHMFSENLVAYDARMCQRGKNDATKYFLIPKQLRWNLKLINEVKCHKMDTKSKLLFVYVMDKSE